MPVNPPVAKKPAAKTVAPKAKIVAAKATTEQKAAAESGELVIENATICDNEAYVKHCAALTFRQHFYAK